MTSTPRTHLPPRLLPVLYFGAAHVALALALVLIGIVGMVAHFWMQDYAGMAWSAGTVGVGIITVGVHVIRCLGTAALPRAVSAHIVLAFVNILGAEPSRSGMHGTEHRSSPKRGWTSPS